MPAKFNILVAASIPLVPLIPLIACGGDDGAKVDSGIHVVDTNGSGSGSGSGSAACTADSSYGAADFGSGSDQFAQLDGSGSAHSITWGAAITSTIASQMPDVLQLELYAGYGAFGSGDIHTGTFQITGSDSLNYKDCGVCLRLLTDVHQGSAGPEYTDDYFASAGSVTVDHVSGNTFSGTMSNITFKHVMIAQDLTTTDVGDCTASLTSGTMNTALTMGSAAFTGRMVNGKAVAVKFLPHRTF